MEESTISEISNSLSEPLGEWTQAAGQAVDEVKDRTTRALNSASPTVDETLTNAKYRLQSAAKNERYHVRRTAQEKPLQLIAGFAAAAFIAGVVLRVWRSNQHAVGPVRRKSTTKHVVQNPQPGIFPDDRSGRTFRARSAQ